jgi:hypothetical protein
MPLDADRSGGAGAMTIEAIGSIGDFIGGLGVIASLIYLAVQIRQNTRAVRSSSYHQAAEQTWNYCLALAQDSSLAEIIAKQVAGEGLTPAEQLRLGAADQALIFGFENMLRLHEEGLVDPDVWDNLMANSLAGLGSPRFHALLADRPGPLSGRLRTALEEFARKYPGLEA